MPAALPDAADLKMNGGSPPIRERPLSAERRRLYVSNLELWTIKTCGAELPSPSASPQQAARRPYLRLPNRYLGRKSVSPRLRRPLQ